MSTKLSVNDFLTIVDAFIQPEINAGSNENYAKAKEKLRIVLTKLLAEDEAAMHSIEDFKIGYTKTIKQLDTIAKELLAMKHHTFDDQLLNAVQLKNEITSTLQKCEHLFYQLLTKTESK